MITGTGGAGGHSENEISIAASPQKVFEALTTPDLALRWLPPPPMTCEMHAFDARPGGAIHYVLTMPPERADEAKTPAGDVCRGRFVEVEPPSRLVEVFTFDGDDPGLRGEMEVEITLEETTFGTRLRAVCRNIPPAIDPVANRHGWDHSLHQLRELVEG
ncbi:SRPBCC domain-containing protein [Wenxinia marina]|uniref:Activator of Hsp90 ATPase homologue 1/2-like C-terminal domain-containing protein n=2 Tax=Wenxinia TaxID=653686 RepID=A0A0D0Q264_9RHOB|nr:SRPBCC domain-containing protein [Wenxinia marina]KIQ68619.1 hypothetical protein Wenmar_02890 [Wenxinia marina DSM 24838]GGL67359.1 ATPase [Wenxinia marina]